ncbi:CO or xanthine dehydrogenase, Mo-binding subunit [Algoriphagus faecimaris]|uniref:CO or xanthine dehydrogenase, Mo-binding subunit n=1 Tax=Algoriphagus faecimaris TaxID=686796 RepID=A0A1G6TNJ1_9BACT|nr:molybdopterin cofactor-binding domain-containing protein [Algoriphagus faecimaris]SDD30742.1 CO or xanthine dehydrogenase, Mo-binding subunit [Algoriphagus faecimaris]
MSLSIHRRNFLKTSGQLLIGFNLFPLIQCNPKEDPNPKLLYDGIPERPHAGRDIIDSWIRLDASGHVTVLTGKQELGQGIRTALLQIAAEELEVPFEICHIINGDTGQTANEGYTAGSNSVEGSGTAIRQAAANAKRVLIREASKKWNISEDQIKVKSGNLTGPQNQKISYWDLLEGRFIEEKVNDQAPFKDPKTHQIVGKSIPRADIENLVRGNAHFVHDLRLPGMLHARVLHPPVYGSMLRKLNTNEILKIDGVKKVIIDGSFVAIVARREYQAVKAWQKAKELAEWEKSEISVDPSALFEHMEQTSQNPVEVESKGNSSDVLSRSSKKISAIYQKPYHIHGSMGTGCAVAKWENGNLTVWSPTQGVYPLQNTLADLLNLEKESIRCIGMPGSGCYGHNSADDVSAEASLIAKQIPDIPVRLQWMREDEHQWEPYGTAMQVKLEAAVDEKGNIIAWNSHIWSDAHSTRPNGRAGHYISARHLENPFEFEKSGFSGGSYRNAPPLYDIPHVQILLSNYDGPLRTSALRSLGAYGNIFALECFMDELTQLANQDPFDFRINNLKDQRAIAVLEKLKTETNWNEKSLNEKSTFGIAFAKYKNSASYFAVLAEIEPASDSKKFRLKKLTGVIESGQCINPDGLKNQTEGGMIQSASWTILEQVKFDSEGIQSKDWSSYPILRANSIPEIEVHIINRPEEKPLGAGEAAQGPVAAAIVNALSSALGRRVRKLPLKEYFEA